MEQSFRMLKEWKEARVKRNTIGNSQLCRTKIGSRQWTPPGDGELKINVDASWFESANFFSIGMVTRDQKGHFIEVRTMAFHQAADVFEAECIGMKEALSWVLNQENKKATVETDSMLTIEAIKGQRENMLEVGHVIDQCKSMLLLMPDVKVKFVRKQASKVAHELARLPCMINGLIVYTAPLTHLVELYYLDFN